MNVRLLNARQGTYHQVPVREIYTVGGDEYYSIPVWALPSTFPELDEAIQAGATHYDAHANEVLPCN